MISFVWSPGERLPAGTGGSENFTVGHVRELNRRGIEARVVTIGVGTADGRDEFDDIPFHSVPALDAVGRSGRHTRVRQRGPSDHDRAPRLPDPPRATAAAAARTRIRGGRDARPHARRDQPLRSRALGGLPRRGPRHDPCRVPVRRAGVRHPASGGEDRRGDPRAVRRAAHAREGHLHPALGAAHRLVRSGLRLRHGDVRRR